MLHKGYKSKDSVEKRIAGGESQGTCRQVELIGGKSQVAK
jgi:hypothetical protein